MERVLCNPPVGVNRDCDTRRRGRAAGGGVPSIVLKMWLPVAEAPFLPPCTGPRRLDAREINES